MTVGWTLRADERAALIERCPARYPRVIADHVTLVAWRQGANNAALPNRARARVLGRADDGSGVEALVVEIDGTTDRPGGGTYHITWSLADGRAAKESNAVIAAGGWQPIDGGLLDLIPARW